VSGTGPVRAPATPDARREPERASASALAEARGTGPLAG
jgi:hypothetical protein